MTKDNDKTSDDSLDALRQAFGKAAQWFAGEGDEAEPATEAESEPPEQPASPDVPTSQPDLPSSDQRVTPKAILEAMLFVGNPENQSLSAEAAAGRMRGVSSDEVEAFIAELNADYEQRGCPYHVAEVDHGYRLVLRDEFLPLRDNFYGKVRQARLSQAAIDVLALVAYRQPVSREQVDNLRGRDSAALLRQLVRRELLRLQLPQQNGEARLYFTTDRFLQLFGLESLGDLPRGDEMEIFTQN